jgi:hypothetical protein
LHSSKRGLSDGENQPDETLLISFGPVLVANSLLSRVSDNQKKKWVEESPLAQEISTILANHPEYYAEFRANVGGIFPEPKGKSA